MYQSSHRLRVEEKKLYRRLMLTFGFLIALSLLLIYAGLPLLAKIIITFSSLKKEPAPSNNISSIILFPPQFDPLNYEATNTARIALTGYGEKEITVKISVNGKTFTSIMPDNEGKFSAKNITLAEGDNIITAKSIKDKYESSPSGELRIIYKKTLPTLTVTNPKDGDKFSDQKEIIIKGETDPGNRVTINDRLIIVNTEGKFDYPVVLTDGENNFKVKAYDNAGNTAETDLKAFYNP